VLATMRVATTRGEHGSPQTVFLEFVLRSPSHEEYATLAQQCGTSVSTLRQRLHRLRIRFIQLLRAELRASPSPIRL
jgi:hypothetical protein